MYHGVQYLYSFIRAIKLPSHFSSSWLGLWYVLEDGPSFNLLFSFSFSIYLPENKMMKRKWSEFVFLLVYVPTLCCVLLPPKHTISIGMITDFPVLDEPGAEIALKHIKESAPLLGNYTLKMAYFSVSNQILICLLYTSPSPRDKRQSRMPSSA